MLRSLCVLIAVAVASVVQGDERRFSTGDLVRRIDDAAVFGSPIGVTRSGAPVEAVLHRDDLDLATQKTRLILVGQSADDARSIAEALIWFYTGDDAAALRREFVVSAVPLLFPGAERIDRGRFPPQGDAYGDTEQPEAVYLWRWIGMHAPDFVLDVKSGTAHGWYVPTSNDVPLDDVARRLDARREGERGELALALVETAACETGLIPAARVTLPAGDAAAMLREFCGALTAADACRPSPARQELGRRLDRTPLQVAGELSRHYGRELNQVVYIPALALIGRLRLGELADDGSHQADVLRIVAPYVDGEKPTKPSSGSGLSGHLIFSQLAEQNAGKARARFIELSRNAADLAFDESGRPRESMPFHSEMSDALFMGGPILAHVGQLTCDERYFEACLKHLRFMRKLVLRDDGLYRHSPLDEAAWGRGNGFPALGLALCLTYWPPERDDRAELLDMFHRHVEVLARHQDATGCWRQVIDRPESYRELSCTSMIAFAMARGVRNGWLDRDEYSPVIQRAWHAIRLRTPANGRLVDVCTGTGKQRSLRDYYDRLAILGPDARGGAMALLAATEIAAYLETREPR